jgi:hypothetical protein
VLAKKADPLFLFLGVSGPTLCPLGRIGIAWSRKSTLYQDEPLFPRLRNSEQMAKPYRYRNGFRIKWTDGYGKRQSEFHKTRADAVLALSRYLAEREEIKRGLRLGIPIPRKFNELCDYYLEVCSIRKSRPRDDKTMIDRHLRAFFGHLYLKQIEEHVDEYQGAIVTLLSFATKLY